MTATTVNSVLTPAGLTKSNLEKLMLAQYIAMSSSVAGHCHAFINYSGHTKGYDFAILSASNLYDGVLPQVYLFPIQTWFPSSGQGDLSILLDRFIQFLSDISGTTVYKSAVDLSQLELPFLKEQAA